MEATTDSEKIQRELEGTTKGRDQKMFTLLECHVNIDLEGFEDLGEDETPTGIKLPYIVTLEEGTRKILSIRRNFAAEDIMKTKINYFVHFKFLPGLGFYGFGLTHMIGGLSRTATAALRQLLDAGTLSNLPAGFKMRGIKMRDESQSIQPGEFRDVDAPGGNLKDAFMTLPFKEPSANFITTYGCRGRCRATIRFDCRYASRRWKSTGSSGHDSSYVGERGLELCQQYIKDCMLP